MSPRQITQACIRATAVAFCLWAFVLIGPKLFEPLFYGNWTEYLRRPFFTLRHELREALPLLVAAVTLWLIQRPLAKWIVPRFGPTCPECGYDLRGSEGDRCPECGTERKRK